MHTITTEMTVIPFQGAGDELRVSHMCDPLRFQPTIQSSLSSKRKWWHTPESQHSGGRSMSISELRPARTRVEFQDSQGYIETLSQKRKEKKKGGGGREEIRFYWASVH